MHGSDQLLSSIGWQYILLLSPDGQAISLPFDREEYENQGSGDTKKGIDLMTESDGTNRSRISDIMESYINNAVENSMGAILDDKEGSNDGIDEFIQTALRCSDEASSKRSLLHQLVCLSEALGYEVLAEMNEPVVDTSTLDGFQIWTDWFDTLKTNEDIIKAFLGTL